MITAKFGGTAVTPANLKFIKQCVTDSHGVVVVSAIGKEHSADTKVTDLLAQYYQTQNETFWNAVEDKYRRLAEVNGIDVDVDRLLKSAHDRALKYNLDYCLSLGEELAAKIVAKFLNATYIEAADIVRFGKRRLLYKDTVKSISARLDGVQLAVIGGFYGSTVESRKVFTRGGGDVTGSLAACATDSSLYENWTDVYGVCAANPVRAFDVATVPTISYSEMFVLSKSGAEVLHPDAVRPCRDKAIPIRIGNFYNPDGDSTLVSNCSSNMTVLSLAEKTDLRGRTVTTLLHNLPVSDVARALWQFFSLNTRFETALGKRYCVCDVSPIRFTCEGAVVRIVTKKSILCPLYKFLKSANYLT